MTPKRTTKKSNINAKKRLSLNKNGCGSAKLGDPMKKNDSKFTGILNKKWKVFRVSPIYNFSKNKLKYYEKKLDEEMNSKEKPVSNVVYKSKLTLNKNLKFNDQCADALQVEILKENSQSVYTGHFLSWNNTEPVVEGSVCLPILLVEGKTHIISGVHSCLCKIFDCDIQPVTFSFYALITFFVKLLETPRNHVDVTREQVTLEYKVPECEVNDRIKISFILEATTIVLAVIMDSLQEKYQGITPMQIILEFYNKILNHAHAVFKMDLMLAELQKIVFPDVFLTNDGQLKIFTDDAAISTLDVLQRFTPLDAVTNI